MMSKTFSFLFIIFLIGIPAAAGQTNTTEDGKTVLLQLDETTWIEDINWNPKNETQVEVKINSEIPTAVSLQEIPDFQGKSGKFTPMQSYTLNSGVNTVLVPYNGKTTKGIAITDSEDGAYINKRAGGDLPEAQGAYVLIFMGWSILVYELLYRIRARLRLALLAVEPQRDK